MKQISKKEELSRRIFAEMPVPRAVLTMVIPTVISQLITVIYNMADTYFIGQMNDPNMVAATALQLPIYIFLAALSMTLAHLVRAEGFSKQASIGIAMGGILNIVLDPIFIFPIGWGIIGAAFATMLSNLAAAVYFLLSYKEPERPYGHPALPSLLPCR